MSVSVTNTDAALSGKALDTLEGDQTITGLKTFSRSTNPPFAVNSGSAKVTNLNADLLDGEEATALHALANATGTLAIANGGTGAATASANVVFAGPTSGGAAAPSFRALVTADISSLLGALNHDTAVAEVVSSSAETTVYTYSVAGGVLSTNRAIRVSVIGDYLNNVGAQTFTFKMKYGSTTLFSGAISTSSGANRSAIMFEGLLSAAGATNTQVASGRLWVSESADNNATGNATVGSGNNRFMTAVHNSVAEDSTGALNLVLTAQHNGSSASLSFRCHAVHVELV